MNQDGTEIKPAPKAKLHWLLKLAIFLSIISLLCSIIVTKTYTPPFPYGVTVPEISFIIAFYAGAISIPVYGLAIAFGRGRRVLAIILGVASLLILPFFGVGATHTVMDSSHILKCENNLESIGAALKEHIQSYDDFLLDTNWCDVLVNESNIPPEKFSGVYNPPNLDMTRHYDFERDRSTYALNKNLLGKRLSTADPNTVLIFETHHGWNQIGDANDLSLNHYFGCDVFFVNGKIRFITKDKISELRWNP